MICFGHRLWQWGTSDAECCCLDCIRNSIVSIAEYHIGQKHSQHTQPIAMQLYNKNETTQIQKWLNQSSYTFLKYVHLIPVWWQYQYTLQMKLRWFSLKQELKKLKQWDGFTFMWKHCSLVSKNLLEQQKKILRRVLFTFKRLYWTILMLYNYSNDSKHPKCSLTLNEKDIFLY